MSRQSSRPAERVLASGLAFGESPRWHDDRLWFCNWGTGEVLALGADGHRELMLTVPTTIPFSIDWLADGRMLVVSGREGLLLRQERDGSLATHADLRPLSRNPWNEIVVDGRGNIYVNGGGAPPPPGAMFGPGTIVLVTSEGAVRQVADDIAFANGMAITPDNRTLIVAESHANGLTAFDIEADGSLANRRVWADLGDGFPDGICIDAEGAVWYADVPNQHCVRVRQGGAVLQTVTVDRGCFACMLGGPGRKTLFIMAAEWRGFEHMMSEARTGMVLTAETDAPGVGWP
jgi:sugar lactone lactonase YvrE